MYDVEDDRGVPVTTGIPKLVLWTGFAGVVLIFVVAGMVLATAGANHVWPAEASTNLKL
jgi:hypothetical protein